MPYCGNCDRWLNGVSIKGWTEGRDALCLLCIDDSSVEVAEYAD